VTKKAKKKDCKKFPEKRRKRILNESNDEGKGEVSTYSNCRDSNE
jgi:hypothetical protein